MTVYCLKQHGTVVKKGPFMLVWQFTLARCGKDMDMATFAARGYGIEPLKRRVENGQ